LLWVCGGFADAKPVEEPAQKIERARETSDLMWRFEQLQDHKLQVMRYQAADPAWLQGHQGALSSLRSGERYMMKKVVEEG